MLKRPRAVLGCRARLVRLASDCMGTAANPAKGGFVREALINQYPKLAALLEDTLHKIRRDTEVRSTCPLMCLLSCNRQLATSPTLRTTVTTQHAAVATQTVAAARA